MTKTRRDVLKGAAAATAAVGLGATRPFGVSVARAQDKKSVKIASMGPITGIENCLSASPR